jgi:proteic killer suppression protein
MRGGGFVRFRQVCRFRTNLVYLRLRYSDGLANLLLRVARHPEIEDSLIALSIGVFVNPAQPVSDGLFTDGKDRGELFFFRRVTLDVPRTFLLLSLLIVGYRDKRTSDFAAGKKIKAFSGFERAARLKLDRLEAAIFVADLSALPGNRFEALKGDRKGQFSIRINDQWRICFEWPAGAKGPLNVEIVDYH